MTTIPTQSQNPKGLHRRYHIEKIVEANGMFDDSEDGYKRIPVDPAADYFVLRLDEGGKDLEHIAACRIAAHAYADAIKDHLPKLASDLKSRYPLLNYF